MKALIKTISRILDRSIDYVALIGYALHNIFFAMAIEARTLRLHTFMLDKLGLSAIWILIPLMLGLLLSACLFLHWRIRVYGTFPLVFVAFLTVAVYVADNAPLRTVFGIAGLYYSLALMPHVLMIVYGRLTDALKRSYELEDKLLKAEARFATGQTSDSK